MPGSYFPSPQAALGTSCWLALALVTVAPLHAGRASPSGKQIFRDTCVRCHGERGAGTEDHPTSLTGDLSIQQLADRIHETMPDDDPGSLSADDAQAVAAYIHGAFYSPIAQARNRPARIGLARLTVRQYRQTLADLLGSFADSKAPTEQHGLKGKYFAARQLGKGDPVANRIDPNIDFDFGTDAPLSEITEPRTFSVLWSGALTPPTTGGYEFVVRTEHSARLKINGSDEPLVDASVQSGDQTEHRSSLFLLEGRAYPISLEFFKLAKGVDDPKGEKQKSPSAPASIRVLWKRPDGRDEPIPTECLSTDWPAPSFICSVTFPPDDRSFGWERGISISQAWDESVTEGAIAAADFVSRRLNTLAGVTDDSPNRPEALREFCRTFVERAFRRPLSPEVEKIYIDQQFADAESSDAAVRRVVLLALKSPRFLFREVGASSDQFDVASRLSFGLWDSLPDQALLDSAKAGLLADEQNVRQQAQRMLGDVRAKDKLLGFLRTWLRMDASADLTKDAKQFPDFDAAAIADVRTSLEMFLGDIVSSPTASYRELLLDDRVYLNARLATLYGAAEVPESGFKAIRLDDGRRAGVVTHPYVMARFAHARESSPIHRGVFLARGVLGKLLRPPPQNFTPLPAELHPNMTTRERVAQQTSAAACMNCHTVINPLGFTLERFDAIGKFRETDDNKPVDDAASYQTAAGLAVTLHGGRGLAEFLANNGECHAAFAEQMFHHLVQQPVNGYGPHTLDRLRSAFVASNFSIRALAVEIMTASALVGRDNAAIEATSAETGGAQLVGSH